VQVYDIIKCLSALDIGYERRGEKGGTFMMAINKAGRKFMRTNLMSSSLVTNWHASSCGDFGGDYL